jgi:hypothetical protein
VTIEQSYELFDRLFDFSLFKNIEKGIFRLNGMRPTPTVNYHLLATLKSLELCRCSVVTDVSYFKNIRHLSLNWCSGITDVSTLGNGHTLSLIGCLNIHDVSALGRLHALNLSGCYNVTDLSELEWVYSLTFHGFQGTDVSGLKNIVILTIPGAKFVTDIAMLHSLEVLNIVGCERIFSLSGFTKIKGTLDG